MGDQAKVAAIDFQGWQRRQREYKPPSKATWSDQIEPAVRLAWAMMFLSKQQLVAWCGCEAESAADALDQYDYVKRELKAALDLITSAEARLIVGVTAAEAANEQR